MWHVRTCVHVCITWAWHVAAQESRQHEGRRIAQATLVELQAVEEDLGQTAFGVK